MRGPTIKTLLKYWPDCDAKRIKRILQGKESPLTVERTKRWYDQCYNPPRERELIRHAVDVLIDGHGLEGIMSRGGRVVAEYSNQGDAYACTILFRGDNAWVGTWGGFVESWERRNGEGSLQ